MKQKGRMCRTNSTIRNIAIGAAVSVIACVVLSALSAALLSRQLIDMRSTPIIASCIQFLSVFWGALTACILEGEHCIAVGGITTAVFAFLLICVTILCFDGNFSRFWTSMLSVITGGVAACVICLIKRERPKKRRRIHS